MTTDLKRKAARAELSVLSLSRGYLWAALKKGLVFILLGQDPMLLRRMAPPQVGQ